MVDVYKPRLVGAKEFEEETGIARRSFYYILGKMKEAGVAAKTQRKIDMGCQWIQNYLATNGTGQRKHTKPAPIPDTPATDTTTTVKGLNLPKGTPTLAQLMYYEQFGKVEKVFIDNAVKKKSVVSLGLVEVLVAKIDEALIRIITDGESSFVPQMCKKVRGVAKCPKCGEVLEARATDEEIKKFWRKEIGKFISPVKSFLTREVKRYVSSRKTD